MVIDRTGPGIVTAADLVLDPCEMDRGISLRSVPPDMPIVVLGKNDVCKMVVIARVGYAKESIAATVVSQCSDRPIPEIRARYPGHRLTIDEQSVCPYGVLATAPLDIEDWTPKNSEKCNLCGRCSEFAKVETQTVSRALLDIETVGTHAPAHVVVRGMQALIGSLKEYRQHLLFSAHSNT